MALNGNAVEKPPHAEALNDTVFGYPVPLNRDKAPKGHPRFDTGRGRHRAVAFAIQDASESISSLN